MLRTIWSAGLIVFASSCVFAQTAEAPPSFEVASIKAAPPPTDGRLMVRMSGGPDSQDPGRLTWTNVSLRDMIRQAYGVKDYQLTAPDWANSTRFDVSAKMPSDTTREQLQLMLQGLLAERFGLKMHREQKEMPMYSLIVGKNGPKLKESTENSTLPGMGPGGPMGAGRRGSVDGPGALPPLPGKDGAPAATLGMRAGAGGPPAKGRGGMMMMGSGHLAAAKMQIAGLADNLTRMLAKPVVDMTGLKGEYDFVLDWTPDENERGMMPAIGMPRPDGGPGGAGGPADARSQGTPGATIFTALQEQLGLKLEAKKAPIDLIVIDHVEKTATEN